MIKNASPANEVWLLTAERFWMKYLFLTNIPSPYRVDFFNELGKLCDLTVAFETGASKERDASWKQYDIKAFKPVFLNGIKYGVAEAFCPNVIRFLRKNRFDRIILCDFTGFTGMLAILWLRMKKIPYWLESDGGFAKNGKGFKEEIKKFFIKDAQGYFSTAQEHDRYYMQYGARPDRIWRYPFTSIYRKDILDTPISTEQKMQLRKDLGIIENNVIIAVGQFIPRKGFDVLINAMALLPEDIGCYIIGGEPTEEYLRQVAELNLRNVHFVGFKTKDDLAQYYMAGDLFVHPTREDVWGLVVNEAMAKGLPVVTTDRCIAGVQLIKTLEQGCIVPVEKVQELAQAIKTQLEQATMDKSRQILINIDHYCFEEMAKRHVEILDKSINQP